VFEKIYNKLKLSPELIWSVLRNLNIKDRENLKIYNGELVKAFEAYKSGDISKDALYAIFKQIGAGCDKTIRQLILIINNRYKKTPKYKILSSDFKETSNGVFHDETIRIHFIWARMKDKNAID
jgi:Glu-tRNA(Gln) amidotransferase subunit E-like FAD-binding protein